MFGEIGGDGLSFDTFADVADVVTTTGHSTRDAILGVVSQGINILPQIFNRNNNQQQQTTPPVVYYDPNQLNNQNQAGVNLGLNQNGLNGGLQLNTTTLLLIGLAAVAFLKK